MRALERAAIENGISEIQLMGEAGSGAVKVVISGKHECRRVTIDPKTVDPEDIEMLEDLVTLAFNDAVTKLAAVSEARMRQAVPLPPGMKMPF